MSVSSSLSPMIPSISSVAGLLDERRCPRPGRARRAAAASSRRPAGEQADQARDGVPSVGRRRRGRCSGKTPVAEHQLADPRRSRRSRRGPVELGDDDGARHADGGALLPEQPGGAVDAVDGRDDEEGGVGGAQPGPQLTDEVGVAGGVQQVDPDAVALDGRQRRADTERCWRSSTSSWSRRSCRPRTRPARLSAPVATSEGLGQGRLARAAVADQRHVAHVVGPVGRRCPAGGSGVCVRLCRP